MKKSEFTKERKVQVTSDQGVFEFDSYKDMLGNFMDVTNTEQWAKAHHSDDGESCVFVAHRFDTTGKIVENHMTHEEAEDYSAMLNEYYAIAEEYSVEEIQN